MKKKGIAIFLTFITVTLFFSACTINKYKDLSVYTNLLLGTNNGIDNYILGNNNYGATMEAEGNAVKVTSTAYDNNKEGGSGWLLLLYSDGNSMNELAEPEGEIYSLAFEVKSNIKDAKLTVKHSQYDERESQIDFGTVTTKKADVWTQVILKGELKGVPATSQGVYFDLRDNPAGTEICIRNLQLIKGNV